MYYFWLIAVPSLVGLFVLIGYRLEHAAVIRRRNRFVRRGPIELSAWNDALPDMPPETITASLNIISDALKIPPEYLRLTDCFDDELHLVDSFWTMLEDDDSPELIADHIEREFDKRPETNWVDLKHAMIDTCQMVQKYG